jgi:hypothetical protein
MPLDAPVTIATLSDSLPISAILHPERMAGNPELCPGERRYRNVTGGRVQASGDLNPFDQHTATGTPGRILKSGQGAAFSSPGISRVVNA